MEAIKVGVREFREKLSSYVAEAETPVVVTRHGQELGTFFPNRRKRTEAERVAFREAFERVQADMAAVGVTEEQIIEDIEELHRANREAALR